MTRSHVKDSPRQAEGRSGGDRVWHDPQNRSLRARSREEGRVQVPRDAKRRLAAQPRWVPGLLALLFVACLLFAAWVWYQIFRILT